MRPHKAAFDHWIMIALPDLVASLFSGPHKLDLRPKIRQIPLRGGDRSVELHIVVVACRPLAFAELGEAPLLPLVLIRFLRHRQIAVFAFGDGRNRPVRCRGGGGRPSRPSPTASAAHSTCIASADLAAARFRRFHKRGTYAQARWANGPLRHRAPASCFDMIGFPD